MIIYKPNRLIFIIILAAMSIVSYNTTSIFAQTNGTQVQDEVNYENFHSNIQQIIGHIEMAEFNKNNGNDSLTLAHTLHPIEEVLSLVVIPLNNTDSNLNNSYTNSLVSLSNSAAPGNNTNEGFGTEAKKSIDLSNTIISTVVPAETLNDTNHNITVIQDLLTTLGEEYTEGVQDGNIVMMLEYQDGSAFMDRAYDIFNNTESITNEREEITMLFNNLTNSVEQLGESAEINRIVEEINHELSESSTTQNMTESGSEENTANYISNIRQLLDQSISAYESGDTIKAVELATTAYLENFEHIEAAIGDELAEEGEELLREQLREQINNNAPVEEIQQSVDEINKLLDESESATEPS